MDSLIAWRQKYKIFCLRNSLNVLISRSMPKKFLSHIHFIAGVISMSFGKFLSTFLSVGFKIKQANRGGKKQQTHSCNTWRCHNEINIRCFDASLKLKEAETNTSKFMTGKIFIFKKSQSTCGEVTFAEKEEAKVTDNKLSSNNNIYASSLSDLSSNKVGIASN